MVYIGRRESRDEDDIIALVKERLTTRELDPFEHIYGWINSPELLYLILVRQH
jgi:hypothetical protein